MSYIFLKKRNVKPIQKALNKTFRAYFRSDSELMVNCIMGVRQQVIQMAMKDPGAQRRLTLVEFISMEKDFGEYVQATVQKILKELRMMSLE